MNSMRKDPVHLDVFKNFFFFYPNIFEQYFHIVKDIMDICHQSGSTLLSKNENSQTLVEDFLVDFLL